MEKRMTRDKYGRPWIVLLAMGLPGMALMAILPPATASRKTQKSRTPYTTFGSLMAKCRGYAWQSVDEHTMKRPCRP